MKDYSKMSAFEISGYVSMHEHGFSWIEFDDEMASHVKCGNDGSPGFAIVEVKDYCNNPSDAWPIIKKNEISICFDDSMPTAYKDIWLDDISGAISDFKYESNDDNVFRAAMIVYLIMRDAE